MGKFNRKQIIKKKIEINNNDEKIVDKLDSRDAKTKKRILNNEIRNVNKTVKITNGNPTQIKKNNKVVIPNPKLRKNDERVRVKKITQSLSKSSKRDAARAGKDNVRYSVRHNFTGKYHKKDVVDYDIIFCIGSYNRFDKVKRLIDQIYGQETNYKFKVILYDDGSTEGDYDSFKNYENIDYIRGSHNNGKRGYFKTITTLWTQASKYQAHTICQTDDDFILCERFIDTVMHTFFTVKEVSNEIISVYYHKTSKENNEVDVFRVDGGVMFDYEFIDGIGFHVPEPSNRQYTNGLSSGVWRYVSEQIKANKLTSHRMPISLVKHDGNEDSKMHYDHRIEAPIHSYDFKDDIND